MNEEWMQRLKSAYDAGYYRTEAAREEQVRFPWQGKMCRDCPFWLNEVCRVHAERRSGVSHTCSYFDQINHAAAQSVIESRMRDVRRVWWQQFGR